MQQDMTSFLPGAALVDYQQSLEMGFCKEESLEPENHGYSATCKVPSLKDYPGPYQFDFHLNAEIPMKISWLYSQTLKKVYVNMLSKLSIQFKWDQREAGLRVRAMLVYCSEDDFESPVLRCPNHSAPSVPCNQGFKHLNHVIRCDHDHAQYHEDPDSRRLSVVVPLDVPHPGTDWVTVVYTFVCKNSCPVGMNRRATAVIFTLERPNGEVIGRRKMGVRICSCPKRDKEKEERDLVKRSQPVPEYVIQVVNPEQSGNLDDATPTEVDNNTEFSLIIPKEIMREMAIYERGIILYDSHTSGEEISPEDRQVLMENQNFVDTFHYIWPRKTKKRKIT